MAESTLTLDSTINVPNLDGGASSRVSAHSYFGQTFASLHGYAQVLSVELGWQPVWARLLVTEVASAGNNYQVFPSTVLYESNAFQTPATQTPPLTTYSFALNGLALQAGQTYAFVFDAYVERDAQQSPNDSALVGLHTLYSNDGYTDGGSISYVIGPFLTGTRADHFENPFLLTQERDVAFTLGFSTDHSGRIPGSDNAERVYGTDAPMHFDAGNGADTLYGSSFADILFGGAGNDRIESELGNDRLYGGDGDDSLDGGNGTDTIVGGTGYDALRGGVLQTDLRDAIFGGDGDDSIDGGYGNDELRGDAGNDLIEGGFGADTVIGGSGSDSLSGAALSDYVFGGAGIDFINGGWGHDRLNGGTEADRFYHLGIFDHGSDWIQDYSADEGDLLIFGDSTASRDQFQVNFAHATSSSGERAGDDAVAEAFVIYRPTEQIVWALVDGEGQDSLYLQVGLNLYDLYL